MKKFLRLQVIPRIAAWIIRLLVWTLRIEIEDSEGLLQKLPSTPLLFAFWHNRLLIMGLLYRLTFPTRSVVAMISRSRDGEMIARVNDQFRLGSARGSSSKKGNTAVREVIRKVTEENCDVAITPDGPRGPIYRVQPGVVQISQLTGHPIIPVTYHLSSRKELRSWDRFQIPYPFARCRLVFGKAIQVPPEVTSEEIKAYCAQIEASLGK